MAVERSVLVRALRALRERGVLGVDGLVVANPWSILDHVELPRECVAQLTSYGCLIGLGQLRFRIVRESLPNEESPAAIARAPEDAAVPTPSASVPVATALARPPRFLLVLDAENPLWTARDAGLSFAPAVIRKHALMVGHVAFAFAHGNMERVPLRVREDLTIAGFPLMHCQRLRDGNGGKDTVDENLQDLIRRFLHYDVVDGVIIVTDDRDYAPIMNGVLDLGKRLVRFTLRGEATLDQIGEVQQLQSGEENDQTPTTRRRWQPELIIEDLRQLPLLPQTEQGVALRRMQLRCPLVFRFLRAFIRRLWGRLGPDQRGIHFPSLVTYAEGTVYEEDRPDVSRDDLKAFCSMLQEIGLIRMETFQHQDGRNLRAYRPDWNHPFCAAAIADIKDQPPRRRPQSDRVGNGDAAPSPAGRMELTPSDSAARTQSTIRVLRRAPRPHRTHIIEKHPEWSMGPEGGLRRFYVADVIYMSNQCDDGSADYRSCIFSSQVHSVLAPNQDVARAIVEAHFRTDRLYDRRAELQVYERFEEISDDDLGERPNGRTDQKKRHRLMDEPNFELVELVVTDAPETKR